MADETKGRNVPPQGVRIPRGRRSGVIVPGTAMSLSDEGRKDGQKEDEWARKWDNDRDTQKKDDKMQEGTEDDTDDDYEKQTSDESEEDKGMRKEEGSDEDEESWSGDKMAKKEELLDIYWEAETKYERRKWRENAEERMEYRRVYLERWKEVYKLVKEVKEATLRKPEEGKMVQLEKSLQEYGKYRRMEEDAWVREDEMKEEMSIKWVQKAERGRKEVARMKKVLGQRDRERRKELKEERRKEEEYKRKIRELKEECEILRKEKNIVKDDEEGKEWIRKEIEDTRKYIRG